jgi:predicted metalloprotease with PDZ domain
LLVILIAIKIENEQSHGVDMNIKYLVEVLEPKTHIVKVKMDIPKVEDKIEIFLPSWSPGSYLMREYAKNVRKFKALSTNGEFIYFNQKAKGIWEIDFTKSELKQDCSSFTVEYEVYCHELTVRTSHVDETNAFLHGPSYLMGVKDQEIKPTIEFKFSPLWSKLHTALTEVSEKRDEFIFTAPDYDVLIDAPVEIGCHDSDGFMVDGKEHHLVWYGEQFPHNNDLKADIKTIVETVSKHFSSIPYDKYMFITHFKRKLYGGLEHLNSTALHFDGRKLKNRKDYINWLALVAHEYFHTWNVKRIRPIELGPFDYLNENYTRMHWLTEGLTSFMDELFVLRSGLCSLEEYLEMQTKNLNFYYSTPGKKFHSLEDSSFNAWIKLYRPDENSRNSSISYYLKGGLVFSTLHFEFKKAGKNINDLLTALWDRYLANPKVGVTTGEVLNMIEEIGNSKIRELFETRISTTEDIDFETYYKNIGLEFEWEEADSIDLGCLFGYEGDRVIIDSVVLDSAAYDCGLNAKDEILAINNMRVLKEDMSQLNDMLLMNTNYKFTVCRLGTIMDIQVALKKSDRKLKSINIIDEKKALEAFTA